MEAERRLYCEGCGATEFDGGDDGFYYCRQCGSQSQDVVETGYADEDILGDGGVPGSGALYSIFHHRSRPHSSTAGPPAPKKSREEILRSLTQSLAGGGGEKREEEEKKERPYVFDDDSPEPRDFGSGPCPEPEVAATAIRVRYVQGLQIMLQQQCEVMVERFGISPLVCGLAGTIWLRYVAASRVFDDGWARKVIARSEEAAATTASRSWDDEQAAEDQKTSTNIRAKYKLEPHNSNGQRAIYIFFRALRKMIPVYSSLAICFLVCHIARVAVVPTDIYEWVLEGKLPYLAAFVELDKYLGSPSNACPLSTRFLFRPTRVIGAWQLESTAGSIAQGIGLRLPSVNFYALASRYLKDLSLSVENLLPHASRLYEWSVPAELWLSSNASRLPTRVCVMAILIVTLRILYNIHGQGTWEMTLSTMDNSLSHCHQLNLNSDEPNLSSTQKIGETMKEDRETTNSSPVKNLMRIRNSEFNTKELLGILEAAYDNISTRHDFSMDLPSYLKYCKDIIFGGTTTSYDEETLIERLWEIYNKKEDDNLHDDVRSESPGLKGKRSRDEVPGGTLFNTKKPSEKSDGILYTEEERFSTEYLGAPGSKQTKNVFLSDSVCSCGNHSKCTNCYATSKNIALEQMKIEMEENGFHYLSPRAQKRTEGYLIYKRKKVNGRLIYVAHADYYILLRAFARLAQVDVRIMHAGVIKLERRLGWTEQRIDSSLSILHDLSCQRNNELRLASG